MIATAKKALPFSLKELDSARPRARRIFALTLPILIGQLSNAAAGLIDAAMIAPLGSDAIAAVGFGALVFFVVVSFTVGIESASQTLCARRTGERRYQACGHILSEALRLAFVIGLPLGAALAIGATSIVGVFHDASRLQLMGGEYLAARALGLFAVIGIASYRGFYNGTSRPWMHLRVALVVLATQIGLNVFLIHGLWGVPALGTLGAGVSASLAQLLGLALFFVGARRDTKHGVNQRGPRGERKSIQRSLFTLGIPSGLQWALSWIAMLLFLFFAGRIGVLEAGASYLLIQVASLLTLTANSFGFASASLVSEALGKGRPQEAYRWGLACGLWAASILGVAGLGLALFHEPILLILSRDPELVAVATSSLLLCGLVASVDSFGLVMNFSLIGAGAAKDVMLWNLFGMWALCLPMAWRLGVHTSLGMFGLWAALLGARLAVATVMTGIFYRRRWAQLSV